MIISIVIPIYNEIETLALIVERVQTVPLDKEIILVDDFSIDGSRDPVSYTHLTLPTNREV